MQPGKIQRKYQALGLEVVCGKDKPQKTYDLHEHETTYLYTLSGSIKIKVDDGDWIQLLPGQEFIIEDGQPHEAVVGDDGWEYIAAWNPEEAKKYE